ncbi:outer membrane protein assembly factor [Flavobacteriaceae bacterium]|nr:outer membrane protein assembly factor [Flavobacteriaceae bacterium]
MRKSVYKKTFAILIIIFISSCNPTKGIKYNQLLLDNNKVFVNDTVSNDINVLSLIKQNPNSKPIGLGIPLRLYIHNLSKNDTTKDFKKISVNKFLNDIGEKPVLVDSLKTINSLKDIQSYYFSKGWFNVGGKFKIKNKSQNKAEVEYLINTKKQFFIDSLSSSISSPILDSIYNNTYPYSHIKINKPFNLNDFSNERERLTALFRNSGVYHFNQDYIEFENDTTGRNNKMNTKLIIQDRIIKNNLTISQKPFNIYTISDVNVFINKNNESNQLIFEGYNFFTDKQLKFKPSTIIGSIDIKPNKIFKEKNLLNTYKYLNELQTFKYPSIEYVEDTSNKSLIANIELIPKDKYALGFDFNISQSNIQSIGLSASSSIFIRNVFKGAETLQISAFGSIGSSKDGSNLNDRFFDINELGADIKILFPRIFSLFNTDELIPRFMSPKTTINLSISAQNNIGLDKQTANGIFSYNWRPRQNRRYNIDLFNVQYVRNLNPSNYFRVYQNSFNRLENIALSFNQTPTNYIFTNAFGENSLIDEYADDTIDFLISNLNFQENYPENFKSINGIKQRKERLTQNNLIFSTNFSFTRDSKEDVNDVDFSLFKFKFELAGNLLSSISKAIDLNKNDNDKYELFNVEYSQYIKSEIDHIKYWKFKRSNVLAIRSYLGIALPYGNSDYIPFSKSFFAGGANDNRAWTAYNLGPGSSINNNEFNEANFKIALNIEHRFNLFNKFNGAFFIDSGNIWNINDGTNDQKAIFKNFKSLKDLAVGVGFGIRYDLGFFILRTDVGFKAYNPEITDKNRWFQNTNFNTAVYNIGINYPF